MTILPGLADTLVAALLACCAVTAAAQFEVTHTPRVGSTSPGSAAAPGVLSEGQTWHSLSRVQQAALAPLQQEWPHLETQSRRKWLALAGRFPAMPEAERERIQTRMRDWAALTPQQRGKARLHFREARKFPNADRKAQWQAYQALPPEQKTQLAARAASNRHSRSKRRERRRATSVSRELTIGVAPRPQGAVMTPRSIAPTLLQARPGATTIPVSRLPAQPLLDTARVSKIVAEPESIDPKTLLPRRGPQAATVPRPAMREPAAAAPQPAVPTRPGGLPAASTVAAPTPTTRAAPKP